MRRLLPALFLLHLLSSLVATPVAAEPLRFFAVGDLPYTPSEMTGLQTLFAAAAGKTPFVIHVGDIKGGSEPCTDDNLRQIAALFRAQPVPVVYTPGDNEWTDCHRERAGGLNPLDRLERVRDIFYRDPGVLRLQALGVAQPGKRGRDAALPEIYSFVKDGVIFVALHVVGSDNGYRPRQSSTISEFASREQANASALAHALDQARRRGTKVMVILCQADPMFEDPVSLPGFLSFRRGLVQLMADFPGQVLLIHGDTHIARHDRPLIDPRTGQPFTRFVRAEVPGSPLVGGLWIGIDPDAADPFAVETIYAAALGSDAGH